MWVIAVIGDLVASRAIAGRARFQERLNRILTEINEEGPPASRFTISAGDELEAVYRDGHKLFHDLLAITGAIQPNRIRFAIALGSITTRLNPTNPLMVDGPAFHIARQGMTELKRSKESLAIGAQPPVDVKLENDAARLLAHHIAHWKDSRWDVYRQLARGEPRIAIGHKLNLSNAAVYKNIHDGEIDLVRALADDLGRSLTSKLDRRR